MIILLDEYDTPMQEAYVHGFWDEIVSFIRNMFNAAFKTNPYLERAVMTGITRVSKESIFSDLNNLKVVTTTSEEYTDCFGFTEEEVFSVLDEYGLSEKKQEVKDWYDGFIFGSRRDIYNPWSIINYLDTRRLGTYWVNSSSNSLIGKLIREGSSEIKIVMEDLLKGEAFHTAFDEQIIFSQLDQGADAVWSLLLASGYLKAEEAAFNPELGKMEYTLTLTNREVYFMFQHMVENWFKGIRPIHNAFLQSLLSHDLEGMNEYMNDISSEIFSSFDTGKNPSAKLQPERFYHGFVLDIVLFPFLLVSPAVKKVIEMYRERCFFCNIILLDQQRKESKLYHLPVLDETSEIQLRSVRYQNGSRIPDEKKIQGHPLEPGRNLFWIRDSIKRHIVISSYRWTWPRV